MEKKKIGRPKAGGPRFTVRLQDYDQMEQLENKVKAINKKSKFGEAVTRNSFVVEAIMTAIKKVK